MISELPIQKRLASFLSARKYFFVNRFYYVVPTGLVKIEEVPEYAGLIYADPLMKEVKKAPLLHNDRHDVKRLFDKMYYNYRTSLFPR